MLSGRTSKTTSANNAHVLRNSGSSSWYRVIVPMVIVLILMVSHNLQLSLSSIYTASVGDESLALNPLWALSSSQQQQQQLTPHYFPFNRLAIQDILQHPFKSGPSSRATITSHAEESASEQSNQSSSSGSSISSSSSSSSSINNAAPNATWWHYRTAPDIPDCTRNVRRVQDFLQPLTKAEQKQEQQLKQQLLLQLKQQEQQQQPPKPALDPRTTQKTDDSSNPNQQNNKSNQHQQQQQQQHKPLNIMLFYADDWTMKVLGALNPHVYTPHIDGMVKRGMLFTRNCVTTSICWISRNSLATGVYASVHRNTDIWGLNMFQHSHFAWTDTLYAQLKQRGNYYTGLVGKWHAQTPDEHMKVAFDVLNVYYGDHWMNREGKRRHVTDLNGQDALAFLQQWSSQHRNMTQRILKTTTSSFSNNNNEARPPSEEQGEWEEISVERPFFLKVAFFATHAVDYQDPPFQPMPESMSLYENVTIPMPPTATPRHYQDLPDFMKHPQNEAWKRNKGRFDTPEHYQDNIKDLFRMATEVDAVVGAVIEKLKALQAYDNTMIIFTTDNGNLHGEHGLTEKWYPYEESIRVPLVIQDPRMPPERRGTRNDEDFILNIDLTPTILSAAQITPIPRHMQGRDIAHLYLDHDSNNYNNYNNNYNHDEKNDPLQHPAAIQASWRQDFFYEWNTGDPGNANGHIFNNHVLPAVFALIRKDYKYFYWPETDYEQLFHVAEDPYEESDLFPHNNNNENNKAHAKSNATTTKQVLEIMKARYRFLKAWTQAGNPV